MKIGIALSGGGFRATVFHLGMLSRLAAEDLLNQVTYVSSVSGGSLCAGLVYASNDYRWPTPDEFKTKTVQHIGRLATTYDLQRGYIQRILRSPLTLFSGRAHELSGLIQSAWGVNASLKDLPKTDPDQGQPEWTVVTTCYETGKNWYFSKDRMGGYLWGWAMRPDMPIADAMAASSAVPGLVGPLVIDASKFTWLVFERGQQAQEIPAPFAQAHLWDGGIYDNLGLEPLTDYSGKTDQYEYRKGVDFLIVSDASGVPTSIPYPRGIWRLSAAMRLVDIARDQVRSLRARAAVAYIKQPSHPFPPGRYLKIGKSCAEMARGSGMSRDEIAEMCADYLPPERTAQLAAFETTLRKLTEAEFTDLYRHGFELANGTLHVFDRERFRDIRYRPEEHKIF